MTRDELIEALTVAGEKYDGHVTHGSVAEQMKVVDPILQRLQRICVEIDERNRCGD